MTICPLKGLLGMQFFSCSYWLLQELSLTLVATKMANPEVTWLKRFARVTVCLSELLITIHNQRPDLIEQSNQQTLSTFSTTEVKNHLPFWVKHLLNNSDLPTYIPKAG